MSRLAKWPFFKSMKVFNPPKPLATIPPGGTTTDNGGVVPIYKKYTVGSIGIWELIRRSLVLVPERSSGVPLNADYRNPSPASVPATAYTDPVTLPAGDVAENPFWKRDVRRNYPRTAVFGQGDVAGLLTLGSVAAPQIGVGEEGARQLVAVREEGTLSKVFEQPGKVGEVLAEGGMPPVPGNAFVYREDPGVGYKGQYPCRSYK